MSRIRANQITNQSADGAPTVQNGIIVSGVTTSTSVDVDDFLDVGSNIKIGNAGVITATSFVGDGSGLIGVASTDNIVTGTAATFNTYPVDINAGMSVTGVATFDQVSVGGTFVMPSGNTASRTGVNTSVGDFRFNSQTGKVEFYGGSEWKNIGASQPLINNISPTSFPGTAGTSITVVGNNFESGCNVHFVSSVNGSSTAAGSVAFVNSGILTATAPALTVAGEPYGVRVTNPDGGQGLLEAALDAGSAPTWTTPAGSLGTGILKAATLSGVAVTATDPDGQSITYSEVTSVLTSNTDTPATTMNLTLDSANGAITGTTPNVSSDTTYNFTIRASDGTNTNDRAFSLGIMSASEPLYWFRGSSQGGNGGSDTSVVTGWGSNGNNSASNGGGDANNNRLYVYKNGSGSTGTGIHQQLFSNNSVTIPADHDTFKVVISTYTNNTHYNSYGWSNQTGSGRNQYYVGGANWDRRGTGTFTDTIPASMRGNAYHWTIHCYGGQYLSANHQATLVMTYNSANPP